MSLDKDKLGSAQAEEDERNTRPDKTQSKRRALQLAWTVGGISAFLQSVVIFAAYTRDQLPDGWALIFFVCSMSFLPIFVVLLLRWKAKQDFG